MMNKKSSFIPVILAAIVLLVGIGFWSKYWEQQVSQNSHRENTTASLFQKEGEVTFWKGTQKVVSIDVEIAATEEERTKGLMYRPSMPDSVGMLFIFEWEAPLAFWMKNTIISLDIIYVNQQKQIVSIVKNTTPYSEASLPSAGNAQYVVEVVAGFTDQHGILAGDRITF